MAALGQPHPARHYARDLQPIIEKNQIGVRAGNECAFATVQAERARGIGGEHREHLWQRHAEGMQVAQGAVERERAAREISRRIARNAADYVYRRMTPGRSGRPACRWRRWRRLPE